MGFNKYFIVTLLLLYCNCPFYVVFWGEKLEGLTLWLVPLDCPLWVDVLPHLCPIGSGGVKPLSLFQVIPLPPPSAKGMHACTHAQTHGHTQL